MQNLNKIKIAPDSIYEIGQDKKSWFPKWDVKDDATLYEKVRKLAHSTFCGYQASNASPLDSKKFTVVGSPVITNDGVASGFSSSNCIETPTFDFSKPWKISGSFKLLSSPTTNFPIIKIVGRNYANVVYFDYPNNKVVLNLYTSSGLGAGQVYTFSLNTDYNYELGWTGTEYYFYLYQGNNRVVNLSVSSTEALSISDQNRKIVLGMYPEVSSWVLPGSIDLKGVGVNVNGVEVFSGNKTGIDTIKPDDYTVVGTPTISDDGIASGFSASNHLYKSISFTLTNTKKHKFSFRIYTDPTSQGLIIGTNLNFNSVIYYENSNKKIIYSLKGGSYYLHSAALSDYKWYDVVCEYDGISTMYCTTTDVATGVSNQTQKVDVGEFSNSITILEFGYRSGVANYFSGKIDLNAVKVEVDGDSIYQPCLKIPYTEGQNYVKVVDKFYRNRVKDLFEQKGYNGYYTIGEDDFTLPSNKWSDVIEHKENGLTVAEQRVDQTLTIRGACEQGVDVNLPMEFFSADSYAVFGVGTTGTNTASKFTPAADGNYIAIGKGKV